MVKIGPVTANFKARTGSRSMFHISMYAMGRN
jgi:hypothetical protein